MPLGWKAYQRWLYENEPKYYPSGVRNNVKSDFVSKEYKEFLSKSSVTNKSGFENGWEEGHFGKCVRRWEFIAGRRKQE